MNKLTYLCTWLLCALFLSTSTFFAHTSENSVAFNQPQLVRIDFTMPNGYVRHLLLGFTPDNAASDGVDYGYDALNMDNFPDDLNWMINNQRYVIQGVGAFDDSKQYPLGMFISNSGNIAISLDTLENFNSPISVYLFDAVNNTHTLLNEVDFEASVMNGTYLDRFFIAFRDNSINEDTFQNTTLSIDQHQKLESKITYLRNTKELHCKANANITQIEVYSILGKRIAKFVHINSRDFKMDLPVLKEPYGIVKLYTEKGNFSKKVIF